VLGSATPDVKTFQAAKSGAIPVSTLRERVGNAMLPEVELVDISTLNDANKPLAPRTEEALKETVERGDQAIVMLNRRGYAPLMYCLDCTETVRCPECEVGMTYHKGRERVICHYCGTSYAYPLLCAKCGGSNFIPMGEGTERLEEYIDGILPEGTRVLRLDRDATRRQERLEEILGAFGKGEAQVLVGTQMISKGHHFPKVTLVVVSDGDLGLNLPDYRSGERTFQLLVQVAGRAGRGESPGKVFIQTRNPKHPIWNEVLSGDYQAFFEREIGRRNCSATRRSPSWPSSASPTRWTTRKGRRPSRNFPESCASRAGGSASRCSARPRRRCPCFVGGCASIVCSRATTGARCGPCSPTWPVPTPTRRRFGFPSISTP